MSEAEIKNFLKEWIIIHIKNKDLIKKRIEAIEENKDNFDFYVKYKDKEQYFLVIPFLKDVSFFEKLEKEKNYGIIFFHTKENFNFLIENWNKFIEYKNLQIFSANPWSEVDNIWVLFPYTHNIIADESSLKTGLKSMFDLIPALSEREIKNKN